MTLVDYLVKKIEELIKGAELDWRDRDSLASALEHLADRVRNFH